MLHFSWFSLALIISSIPLINLIKYVQKSPEKYKNLPPSPPALPILGHLHLIKSPLHEAFRTLSQKYGPIVHLWIGIRRVIVVTSPSLVQECYTKTNDIVFANRPEAALGKHLNFDGTTMAAAPYGHLWRNLRRFTSLQMLSSARMDATSDLRKSEVGFAVKKIMERCKASTTGSTEEDLKSRFTDLSMNMISMMLMGERYYGEGVANPKAALRFRGIMDESMEVIQIPNPADFFPFLRLVDFRGVEERMIALRKNIDEFLDDIISVRRRNLSRKIGQTDSTTEGRQTLVDTLVGLQETEPEFYTDDIIKGIILLMMLAGTENAIAIMEWMMSLLLNHPDTMKKVQSEIDAQVGLDRVVEENDLPKLTYFQNVIDESIRLCAPAPVLIAREASEDCTVAGYDIPRGTMLLVNARAIHHDENLWDNAEKFMPERFERESGEGYKFIPFGTGRRACPGSKLAYRMIGLGLASFIQAFEWERISDEKVDMVGTSGLSFVKLVPLKAICKPREAMMQHFL